MKIFRSVIGVFIFGISPILSYYLKDESPKSGYVAVQNLGRGFERQGYHRMQRRHFAGRTRSHKNDNIVDSHFKVKKTPPYLPENLLDNWRGEVQVKYWNTRAPIHQQMQQNKEIVKDTRKQQEQMVHVNKRGGIDKIREPQELLNVQRSKPSPINAKYRAQMPQSSQYVQLHRDNINFLEKNIHKTQISTNPHKLGRLNNNQQVTSISLHQPEELYQKIPTSVVVDKTLQKVSARSDRNSKVISRVNDEIKRQISETKYKGEFRKRDTEYNDQSFDMNNDHNSIVLMRKYVNGNKPINLKQKSTKEFSRIGSQEETIEPEDSHYAIFYRMHPDTLDEIEGYISLGSMEHNNNIFNNKNKLLSGIHENELGLKSTRKKKSNTLKFHKLHKKFPNRTP